MASAFCSVFEKRGEERGMEIEERAVQRVCLETSRK